MTTTTTGKKMLSSLIVGKPKGANGREGSERWTWRLGDIKLIKFDWVTYVSNRSLTSNTCF